MLASRYGYLVFDTSHPVGPHSVLAGLGLWLCMIVAIYLHRQCRRASLWFDWYAPFGLLLWGQLVVPWPWVWWGSGPSASEKTAYIILVSGAFGFGLSNLRARSLISLANGAVIALGAGLLAILFALQHLAAVTSWEWLIRSLAVILFLLGWVLVCVLSIRAIWPAPASEDRSGPQA